MPLSTTDYRCEGRQIRCVLFDFGNTLWTQKDKATCEEMEREANRCALTLLEAHLGLQAFPALPAVFLGKQVRKAIYVQVRWMASQTGDYEPDFALATQEALQLVGFPRVERSLAAEVFEALRLRSPMVRVLLEDALTTLAALKARGLLIGAVTNREYGGRTFFEDLKAFGLLDSIDPRHIAVSVNLGMCKPHPGIFKYALNALQVTPAETIMVGDALVADIAGAQALGILGVWKPSPKLRNRALLSQMAASIGAPEQIDYPGSSRQTALSVDDLLEFARENLSESDRQRMGRITPDVMIEQLSDLLTVIH
jgi:HAD superfamily hydrolase (TIGR01509 family)